MTDHRGDVVVRVRTIEADMAAVTAARAAASAAMAAAAADEAGHRARVHPLEGRRGALQPGELITAAGVAGALRETALSAQRRFELARQSLEQAQAEAMAATSRRRAAERLVERRVAATEAEERRRDQRALDEAGTRVRGGR